MLPLAVAFTSVLIVILAAIVGGGVGLLLILVVRESPKEQRARDMAIAKDTAKRTFDATVGNLFDVEGHNGREPANRR